MPTLTCVMADVMNCTTLHRQVLHGGGDMKTFGEPDSPLLEAGRTAFDSRTALRCMLLSISLALAACTDEDESTRTDSGQSEPQTVQSRWYTADNVSRGAPVYEQYCAACHGKKGQGSFTWRQVGADGKYPPPPLNGTGHAWHHPIRALGSQIKFGAPGGGGKMPGFAQTLSDQDVIDVIAWFQDKWSDEIYAAWFARELQSRSTTQ